MTQNYPRIIKLENEELKSLIEAKGKLVDEGRGVSKDIIKIEEEMKEVEEKLIEEEKKVDLKEFKKREKSITKRMEKCIKDMDQLKKDIYEKVKKNTPQELRTKYDKLDKTKEEKEIERNKIALSAQKYNDKIIPLSRDLMKPLLQDEYEDYDTIMIKDGEITAAIFSHLEDWKKMFNAKRKV